MSTISAFSNDAEDPRFMTVITIVRKTCPFELVGGLSMASAEAVPYERQRSRANYRGGGGPTLAHSLQVY